MGDRGAERPLGRARRIDVDPLVVVRSRPRMRRCAPGSPRAIRTARAPCRSDRVARSSPPPSYDAGCPCVAGTAPAHDGALGEERRDRARQDPRPGPEHEREVVADPVDDPCSRPSPPRSRSASSRERSGGEPGGPKLPGARRSSVGCVMRAATRRPVDRELALRSPPRCAPDGIAPAPCRRAARARRRGSSSRRRRPSRPRRSTAST